MSEYYGNYSTAVKEVSWNHLIPAHCSQQLADDSSVIIILMPAKIGLDIL